MNLKTWPVVIFALGGLLLLMVLFVLATRRKTQEIYTKLDEIGVMHRQVENHLRRIRSDIHLSGIFVRDYLLDNSHLTSQAYRERLRNMRSSTNATLAELGKLFGPREATSIAKLQAKIDDYWETFDPLFDWTPAQKTSLSALFLRQQVLPKRDEVLGIAQDLEELNDAAMRGQRAQVATRQLEMQQYLSGVMWINLMLGISIAIGAAVRFHVLEKRDDSQRLRTERAEHEMRQLSHQLVKAQEEERRNLSRELHDQVGQMLTALRIEIGKAERSRHSDSSFNRHVAESKALIETMVRAVRDLSMGLRPSMLDDFGLAPALEWQARDFSRRINIPVNVAIDGTLADLPESHRTCVFRIVQEALTNCARHARASQIGITVREHDGLLRVLIRDDGVGLKQNARGSGLGLIGMEERVRELNGDITIYSAEGAGTTLHIELPLKRSEPAEAQVANSAG